MSEAISTSTVSEAPKPETRVRSSVPVVAIAIVVGLVIVIAGIFAGVKPLMEKIAESHDNRDFALIEAENYRALKVDLEHKRDRIIEQYEAISLFTDRYPNAPEQDTLFRDLTNSSIFAGMRLDSIGTEYPQVLSEDNLESGAAVTPDQLVFGGTDEDGEEVNEAEAFNPVTPAPGTDISPEDSDSYPLGTIPISVSATSDGTRAFIDNIGTTYVASPHLGYYTFGGETGRERLTMSKAEELGLEALQATYFAGTGAEAAGWPTMLNPDLSVPPYSDAGEEYDLGDVTDLATLYPAAVAAQTVPIPETWASHNGYLPLSGVAQSAWIINEIHNSPGRAILIRFVSGGENSVAISGQQFILRELPPLPEYIFGDVNGDGLIEDIEGNLRPIEEGDPAGLAPKQEGPEGTRPETDASPSPAPTSEG